MQRVSGVLECGESKTFEVVDRWAHIDERRDHLLPRLLDEFAGLRAENVGRLRGWGCGMKLDRGASYAYRERVVTPANLETARI
jgi:hypothetical protein